MDTTAIDTTGAEQARARAEDLEQAAAAARRDYYAAVADLVAEHGATAAADALGITRARVYQLLAKLEDA